MFPLVNPMDGFRTPAAPALLVRSLAEEPRRHATRQRATARRQQPPPAVASGRVVPAGRRRRRRALFLAAAPGTTEWDDGLGPDGFDSPVSRDRRGRALLCAFIRSFLPAAVLLRWLV